MRAVVTGGAGFIGSALARRLMASGADVLVYDKLTYAGDLRNLEGAVESGRCGFVQGDVCDGELFARTLAEFRPTAIAHLAAESHVDRSITGPSAFIETNITGAYRVLEGALGYWRSLPEAEKAAFRLLHVSTDEVFGSLGADGFFHEESPYDPRSPYSASKAAADHLASAWGHTYGLPVMISNCSNNYGPYHFPEKLIPLMILNALEGKRLPVYGDGQNVRDWLYVEDHAEALATILARGRPGETYMIGGRAERTNLAVVHALCDLLDELAPDPDIGERRGLIQFVEDRAGHDRRYAVNCAKIERELGWAPKRSFEAGLRETILWFLARRDWWEPIRTQRYSGDRLGVIKGGAA